MAIPSIKNKVTVSNGVVVWLDVDGTILDFYAAFAKTARKHGYDIADNYIPQEYSYGEVMPLEEFRRVFALMGEHWPAKVKAFKGAAEFTRRLAEIGCRVVILTKLPGHQGPERFRSLVKQQIYFDEAYLTYGRTKSDFAKQLMARYVDSRGRPAKHILIDDNGEYILDFVENLPEAYGVSLTVPYNQPWRRRLTKHPRVSYTATCPESLYETSLKFISKIAVNKK